MNLSNKNTWYTPSLKKVWYKPTKSFSNIKDLIRFFDDKHYLLNSSFIASEIFEYFNLYEDLFIYFIDNYYDGDAFERSEILSDNERVLDLKNSFYLIERSDDNYEYFFNTEFLYSFILFQIGYENARQIVISKIRLPSDDCHEIYIIDGMIERKTVILDEY